MRDPGAAFEPRILGAAHGSHAAQHLGTQGRRVYRRFYVDRAEAFDGRGTSSVPLSLPVGSGLETVLAQAGYGTRELLPRCLSYRAETRARVSGIGTVCALSSRRLFSRGIADWFPKDRTGARANHAKPPSSCLGTAVAELSAVSASGPYGLALTSEERFQELGAFRAEHSFNDLHAMIQ